jgi:predicted TIM-barrel fold metal-dependent hydrolase
MTIDGDCHISSRHFDSLAVTADEFVNQMDREGVDKAVVWLKPTYDKDIGRENRTIYEATKRYPDRLVGFGWANPRLGREATLATIKRCFEEYGFYGIKFNGAQDDYVIDDAEMALPYIEEAVGYGKPLAFHIGADFYENTHPYRLGHIAERFPETQFLMVHMGGAGLPALDRSAIEITQEYSNITIIGSGVEARAVLKAIQILGITRVCFGSDTPFCLMHVELAKYRALLRDFSEEDQTKVLGGNLAQLLSLEGDRGA